MKEIIANNKNSIIGSQNHVYTTTIGAVLRCRLAAFVFTAVAAPVAVGGVCPCMETCLRRLVGRDSPLGLFSLNPRPVSSRRGLLLRVAALLLLAASLASPLFSTGGTAHAAVLVSNMGNRMFTACAMGSSLHGGGTHIHSDCTQSFTTGSNAAGYTLTSIELALGASLYTNPPTVKLFSGSATGTVEATFTGLTSLTANTASEAYTFTPSSPVTLSMSTKYWVVAEGGSNFINWSNTESTDEDDTPATGWSISNKGESRSADSTGSFTETGRPRKIRVNGTIAPTVIAPTASDNTVTTDEDTGEGAALVALYEATSGENWEDDTNWKTDEPLHTWYGVTLDTEGWVTGLDLGGNGLRRGIPPAVVVNLRRLRRLYLNDNRLTAVPLAQLEALVSMSDPVLEELALWGNQGLVGMENISPELGRRVDRAALRALYDNNGGPGWREEENWLDEADPFSFSVWYGVMTNDNGRVSELDLDGNGLTGELTNGLEELRGLERLDLYGNAGLSGVLPLGLIELPELGMVDIGDTGVCAPEDATFQRWLADIDFRGEICAENADEDRLEQSGGGGCAVTSTSNTGYTPHSTAFDLLLVVLAMLLLIPIKMNTNSERT